MERVFGSLPEGVALVNAEGERLVVCSQPNLQGEEFLGAASAELVDPTADDEPTAADDDDAPPADARDAHSMAQLVVCARLVVEGGGQRKSRSRQAICRTERIMT